jgi:hypothetical protein
MTGVCWVGSSGGEKSTNKRFCWSRYLGSAMPCKPHVRRIRKATMLTCLSIKLLLDCDFALTQTIFTQRHQTLVFVVKTLDVTRKADTRAREVQIGCRRSGVHSRGHKVRPTQPRVHPSRQMRADCGIARDDMQRCLLLTSARQGGAEATESWLETAVGKFQLSNLNKSGTAKTSEQCADGTTSH